MRLITPKRLKDNEAFMWLADQQLDWTAWPTAAASSSPRSPSPSRCWWWPTCSASPRPTTTGFREFFGLSASPGQVGAGGRRDVGDNPLSGLDEWFARYVEDRRRRPRQDVLTQLATATYPDGSTPEVTAVVRTATFLAAGQETTARLLAAAQAPGRAPGAPGGDPGRTGT